MKEGKERKYSSGKKERRGRETMTRRLNEGLKPMDVGMVKEGAEEGGMVLVRKPPVSHCGVEKYETASV